MTETKKTKIVNVQQLNKFAVKLKTWHMTFTHLSCSTSTASTRRPLQYSNSIINNEANRRTVTSPNVTVM